MQLPHIDPFHVEVTTRLGLALAAGGLIGIERSYHGRPAGFRTHALVALSTALLMVVPVFAGRWFPAVSQGQIVTVDPTRMAQGIMTGIGFLGAGAIMRDGLSIRGLTTAASIWITAAIGVLIGTGFYFPAALATVFTLGTLSLFRWIESRIPIKFYAHFTVRYRRESVLAEDRLRELVKQHGFRLSQLNYRLDEPNGYFEYRMVLQSARASRARSLTETLIKDPAVSEFTITPTGD